MMPYGDSWRHLRYDVTLRQNILPAWNRPLMEGKSVKKRRKMKKKEVIEEEEEGEKEEEKDIMK